MTLEELEQQHCCSDHDCWCHDEEYWKQRLGDNY